LCFPAKEEESEEVSEEEFNDKEDEQVQKFSDVITFVFGYRKLTSWTFSLLTDSESLPRMAKPH